MKKTPQSLTPPKTHRFPRTVASLLLLAFAAAGCVGYRLGSTLPPGINTVYVQPAVNRSPEPLIETDVTRAVIERFQRDGLLKVVDREAADVILEITLQEMRLEPLRYERDQTKPASDYRMTLMADMVLIRTETGINMIDSQAIGESTFFAGSDLNTSRRAAIPDAAQDLARRIVTQITEYW